MSGNLDHEGAEAAPENESLKKLKRKCHRLKRWQWLGLALVVVPFGCLVLYETLVQRAGLWAYSLIGVAVTGFLITFICKSKERQALIAYFSDLEEPDDAD